jgi:uncharacterized membrane protein YidH (DUF202 family)
MSLPSLCIYKNVHPYVLLYNCGIEQKYMDDIDKIINSSKWKELNVSSMKINLDTKKDLYYQIVEKYIYFVVCDNDCTLKIYNLIEQINKFTTLKSIEKFNLHTQKIDEIIKTFVEQENKIGNIHSQVKTVTDTMNRNIAITIDRQDKIVNLEQKTSELRNSAKNFERNSTQLQRNMKWNNIKLMLSIAFVILLVIIIIAIIATQ